MASLKTRRTTLDLHSCHPHARVSRELLRLQNRRTDFDPILWRDIHWIPHRDRDYSPRWQMRQSVLEVVSLGMSKAEVKARLGPPESTGLTKEAGGESGWAYKIRNGTWVDEWLKLTFRNDSLIYVQRVSVDF